jgi:hypothetical protein
MCVRKPKITLYVKFSVPYLPQGFLVPKISNK